MMNNKGGLENIFISMFFLVIIISAILFMLYFDTQLTSIYAQAKTQQSSSTSALSVKEVVMSCHSPSYLDEDKMDLPCPASTMGNGYIVHQLAINGCQEQSWDYSNGDYSHSTPFITVVKQHDSGKFCLSRLEVLS